MQDMEKLNLGAHTSISGGVFNAIYEGRDIRADVVQIFSKNQRQWLGRDYSAEELDKYFQAIAETGVRPVMIHTSYLINLAATNPDTMEKSVTALIDELKRAARLQIPYVVLHPGSHLDAGEEAGVQAIAGNLRQVVEAAEAPSVTILLEATAGQGSNLGYTFEQLRDIMAESGVSERLGVCLDTCHIFAAGYDIRTAAAWQQTRAAFDKIIGLEKLRGVHLNDSKHPLGSRKDRHERIGEGELGSEAFRVILNDPQVNHLPMILEVPGGTAAYAEDLQLLRGLAAGK